VLLRRDEGGVTTLTLNRPAQFNALSQALLGELQKGRSKPSPGTLLSVSSCWPGPAGHSARVMI
jgi:hypothetical protein